MKKKKIKFWEGRSNLKLLNYQQMKTVWGGVKSPSSFLYAPQFLNQPPPFSTFSFLPHVCARVTIKVQEVSCIDLTARDVGYNGQTDAGGHTPVLGKCVTRPVGGRELGEKLVAIKRSVFGEISVSKTVRGSETNKYEERSRTKFSS